MAHGGVALLAPPRPGRINKAQVKSSGRPAPPYHLGSPRARLAISPAPHRGRERVCVRTPRVRIRQGQHADGPAPPPPPPPLRDPMDDGSPRAAENPRAREQCFSSAAWSGPWPPRGPPCSHAAARTTTPPSEPTTAAAAAWRRRFAEKALIPAAGPAQSESVTFRSRRPALSPVLLRGPGHGCPAGCEPRPPVHSSPVQSRPFLPALALPWPRGALAVWSRPCPCECCAFRASRVVLRANRRSA